MGWVQDGTARPGLPGNSPNAFPSEDKHSSENLHEARRLLPRGSQHPAHPLTSLGRDPYRLSKAELSWAPSGPLGTIPTQIWCLSMTCGFSKQTGKGLEAAVEGRDVPREVLNPQHPGNHPRPGQGQPYICISRAKEATGASVPLVRRSVRTPWRTSSRMLQPGLKHQ